VYKDAKESSELCHKKNSEIFIVYQFSRKVGYMSNIKNRFRIKLCLDKPRNTAIRGRFKIFSIIIIAALLVTSCVYYQKLPADWALMAPASGGGSMCPQISGDYNNIGEDANKVDRQLMMLFFEKEASIDLTLQNKLLYRTTHISLQQQDQDSLHITAWRDKKILCSKKLSMKTGDFKCENGWLTISSTIVRRGGLTVAKSWETTRITRSGDYLLVKGEEMGAGTILLFIPAVGSATAWMRFPAVKGAGARELQPKTTNLTYKEIRSPRFSPDGKEIVFTLRSRTSSSIYKVNVNGTNLTLLSKPGDYDYTPVYSPDGKAIIFISVQEDWQRDLCLMKSDGSGKVCLTTGPKQDFNPIFSPDGSKVYFIRALSYDKNIPMHWWQNHDIYSINVDGTGLTRITQMQLPQLADLSIHPDSKRLLAQVTTSEKTSLCIIPLANPDKLEPVTPILDECETTLPGFRTSSCNHPELLKPMFSPDGSSLLFKWKGNNQNNHNENVFIMDLKTQKARKITSMGPMMPLILIDQSFSHDGRKIVFSTLNYFSNPELWIMNSDGSSLHTVDFRK
jgi:Tol biopolymer transport system component